jgi:hypothetical protein
MTTNGHMLHFGTANGLCVGKPGADGYSARPIGLDGTGNFRAPVVVDCRDKSVLYAGTNKVGMFRRIYRSQGFEPVSQGLGKRRYTPSPPVGHPEKPSYLLTAVTATGPGGWSRAEGGDSGFARNEDGGIT